MHVYVPLILNVTVAVIHSVTPHVLPLGGQYVLNVTGAFLGNGSDVAAVRVCNTSTTVLQQTVDSVTVQFNGTGVAYACAVSVTSVSLGTVSLSDAVLLYGSTPLVCRRRVVLRALTVATFV